MAKKKKKKQEKPKKAKAQENPHALVLSGQVSTPSSQENLPAYLSSIKQYPLLSPQREYEIAVDYYENKNPDAAQLMVVSNLRLVVKIASDYTRSGMNLLDLIQEGNIGLVQAVKEYDPYRGVKFSSYASYWIKAYIRSFILRNWSLVKMGTTKAQRTLFYRLQKEKSQLEAKGIIPETHQLADQLHVKEKEVKEMEQRLSGRDVSLSTPVGPDTERRSTLMQLLEDPGESVDNRLAQAEIAEEFVQRLDSFEKTLAGKELLIFRERLRSENPKTLQEIGEIYGVTRERVRQIEARLIQKLKEYMKNNARFMENVIDIEPSTSE